WQLALAAELHRVRAFLVARIAQQGLRALLAVERLEQLVRPLSLVPVDVAAVVGRLVEALGGVAVEDRAAERRTLDGIAIAPPRNVPARQHELKLPTARLAEQRDRALLEAFGAVVVGDL